METLWNIFDNSVAFIAMISISVMIPHRFMKNRISFQLLMGVLLSVMSVFIMINSVHVGNGLYIDARYVIPVIAIIFFGFIPGLIASITIVLVRIFMIGGPAVLVGVTFVVIQFIVVYFYKVRYYNKEEDGLYKSSLKLLLLSFGLQLILNALAFVYLPAHIAFDAVRVNGLYLITIYPAMVYIYSLLVGFKLNYYSRIEKGILRDKFFETMLIQSPNPVSIIDTNGTFIHLNESWINQTGYSDTRFRNVDEWIQTTMSKKFVESFSFEEFVNQSKILEYPMQTRKKEKLIWSIQIKKIDDLEEGKQFYLLIGRDITERVENENRLIDISYHDFLTGLFNRRYYNEVFSLDRLHSKDIHVIYGDMNNLKSLNDYYGHEKGDKAIQVCAEVLKKHFGKNSTLFRFGGDEFLIVTGCAGKEECLSNISEVSKELKTYDFGKINIGISLGIHKLELDQTLDEAVMKAESRMYEYKIFESTSARSGTVDVILTMLFEKDKETERHSKRVQEICRVFIKELDLNTSETSLLLRAALLHDIGKILVPTSIILSEKELTKDEREKMKKHSFLGYRILSSKEQLRDIGEIVLAHHERVDGNGYPSNLGSNEIPYTARILNIADSFEAMTSNRPYAKKMTDEEAIKELRLCSGTQFDTELVEKFIPIVHKLPRS